MEQDKGKPQGVPGKAISPKEMFADMKRRFDQAQGRIVVVVKEQGKGKK